MRRHIVCSIEFVCGEHIILRKSGRFLLRDLYLFKSCKVLLIKYKMGGCLMRKIIWSFLLIMGLSFFSTCHAQDAWVCGDNSSATFVVEETYQPYQNVMEPYGFHVKAKVVRGNNYEVLHYYFYTVNRDAFSYRIPEKSYWGYATPYMNREQYKNIATDRTGRAFAVLKYCLENL